jgi:hypothetical protein
MAQTTYPQMDFGVGVDHAVVEAGELVDGFVLF